MEPGGNRRSAVKFLAVAIAILIASGSAVAIAGIRGQPACVVGQDAGPTPPRANPHVMAAKEPTQITVTSIVEPDPSLIPGSVTLWQVDSSGNPLPDGNLGPMYDDGTHGDEVANDDIFTAQPTLNPTVAGDIYLAVRAGYSGPPGCRQSKNNDWEILVAPPRISMAQAQAERKAMREADVFYRGELGQGVDHYQAKLDLADFLMSRYGPNGTIYPGLVKSSYVTGPNGSAVTEFSSGGEFLISDPPQGLREGSGGAP